MGGGIIYTNYWVKGLSNVVYSLITLLDTDSVLLCTLSKVIAQLRLSAITCGEVVTSNPIVNLR